MTKIVIDPGHGGGDPGAVGNGLQEKDITLHVGLGVAYRLETEYEDVQVLRTRTGDGTVSLQERTDKANSFGADFFLSVHVNAGGGAGFESFRHPSAGERTKTLQYAIHDEIMKFYKQYGRPDRGKKTANFHVLRETEMPAVLIENLFIDNSQEADLLRTVAFRNELIDVITRAVAQALSLKKKAANPGTVLYRVQVGAFQYRENAEKLVKDLKSKGYDAFIVEARK
jgi:N-acetylmuramoyl-L-alanine amidase